MNKWNVRYKKEGHVRPRKNLGKKAKVREEEVANYVKRNPDFILSAMGKEFGMSEPGALYLLCKLGYGYKMWKQAKKSESNTKKL